MPLPLLYSYRRCPYAMRARMALLQAKRPFQAFEIVLRDKPAELLRLSPKGTVPVLQLADGRVLEESWDIMQWALATDDDEGWWGRAQSPANLDLLQRNDGDFKRCLDRYKYPERHAGDKKPRDAARSQAVTLLLDPLEQRLQGQPYLGGNTPCATDIAVFPFVRQFAAVEPGWFNEQALPAVQAWLAAWAVSDLFAACMVKLTPRSAVNFPGLAHQPNDKTDMAAATPRGLAATPLVNRAASPSVTLEPRTAAHAEELFAVLSEPALYQYLDEEPPESIEAFRQKLARGETRKSPDGTQHWLSWVMRNQLHQVVGYVQATVFPNHEANVAYVMGSAYSGQGLAYAAVEKMLGLLANEFGAKLLFIRSERGNLRSVRLAQRLGFAPAPADVAASRRVTASEVLLQKVVS